MTFHRFRTPLALLSTVILAGVSLLSPAALTASASGRLSHGGTVRPEFKPSPLFAISYSLVRDVKGSSPKKGDTITLTFAPSKTLYLLATSPSGDLGIKGTWTYAGKKLTLSFKGNGFTRRAAFKPNLHKSQIKIPFQVFSSKKGASIWKRQSMDPVTGAYRVADAVAAATNNGLPISQLIAAAGKYVSGVTGAKLSASPNFSTVSVRNASSVKMASGHRIDRFRSGSADRTQTGQQSNEAGMHAIHSKLSAPMGELSRAAVRRDFGVQDIVELASGLLMKWEKSQQVNVVLDSFDSASSSPTPLTPGPLANDPRVHLHAKAPGIKKDDPIRQAALFIDPFEATRYMGWNVNGKNYLPSVLSLSNSYATSAEVSALRKDGYAVDQLSDKAATAQNIIKALMPAPGVVMIETHGGADGSIATGQLLGNDPATALSNLDSLQKSLNNGYGMPADAIGAVGVPSIGGPHYFVSLLPAFWAWMENSKGTDLSRSLVYMGACYTDASAKLRDAIKARSYFAFHEEMFTPLVNAAGNYLIRMLARPTVTPEEAYYNMLRIDQTGQEIYVEDAVFNGDLYAQVRHYNNKSIKSAILGVLNAYGDDGHGVVPYLGNGWLGKKVSEGQVWWLVFASRWGQDTKTGVKNLRTCYNTYWKNGQLGGTKSPFCQNANDGSVPTKDEVNYAIYLVSGESSGLGFTTVPRFTLNDGK